MPFGVVPYRPDKTVPPADVLFSHQVERIPVKIHIRRSPILCTRRVYVVKGMTGKYSFRISISMDRGKKVTTGSRRAQNPAMMMSDAPFCPLNVLKRSQWIKRSAKGSPVTSLIRCTMEKNVTVIFGTTCALVPGILIRDQVRNRIKGKCRKMIIRRFVSRLSYRRSPVKLPFPS
jgi:hypothetical protein